MWEDSLRDDVRQKLDELQAEVWSESPTKTLFHYTSFGNYLSILQSRSLWATEARYMNDAREVNYFVNLMSRPPRARLTRDSVTHARNTIISELRSYLAARILKKNHSFFVVSLSAEGDLLSQWRSYTEHGQGLSIGFHPLAIREVAERQGFSIVKCRYDYAEASAYANKLYQLIIDAAEAQGPHKALIDYGEGYYWVFAEFELELLRFCAVFKDPAFKEECEWRLISQVYERSNEEKIKYRANGSFISPYIPLTLDGPRPDGEAGGPIVSINVGPTTEPSLIIDSVEETVRRSRLTYRDKIRVDASRIPLRA